MNAQAIDLPPAVGAPLAGGFYSGRILIADKLYALIVAPKDAGEHKVTVWSKSAKSVPGALSWNDGAANTVAMEAAGSKLAAWVRGLTIGGFTDWYLPAVDELELCYRYLKPTADDNSLWGRSGINVSAVPPTYPYLETSPAQAEVDIFRADGAEAFEAQPYWTSTQHAAYGDSAWFQGFRYGSQGYWHKGGPVRARAVRRLPL